MLTLTALITNCCFFFYSVVDLRDKIAGKVDREETYHKTNNKLRPIYSSSLLYRKVSNILKNNSNRSLLPLLPLPKCP